MTRMMVSAAAVLVFVGVHGDAVSAPAPKPTGEDIAERHHTCLGFFSAKDDANFIKCFADSVVMDFVDSGQPKLQGAKQAVEKGARPMWDAMPDAKSEAQLVLVNGSNVASVDMLTGTNTGSFMGTPASGKKVGIYVGHLLTVDPTKMVAKRLSAYMDAATLMGQMGANPAPHRPALTTGWPAKMVVVAKNDAKEKANIASWKKGTVGWNKHDVAKAFADYAPDVVFHDVGAPTDIQGKGEVEKAMQGYWKAFSDLKGSYSSVWAAGDWVVAVGAASGTNTAAAPEFGIAQKTGKKVKLNTLEFVRYDGGKVKDHWIFYNGVAMAQQLGLIPPPGAPAPAPAKTK